MVKFAVRDFPEKQVRRKARKSALGCVGLACFLLCAVICAFATPAQTQQTPAAADPGATAAAGTQTPGEQLYGTITGTIVDASGGSVAAARVTLTRADPSPNQQTES